MHKIQKKLHFQSTISKYLRATLPFIWLLLFLAPVNLSNAAIQSSGSLINTATVSPPAVHLNNGSTGSSAVTSTYDYASVSVTGGYTFYQKANTTESSVPALDGETSGNGNAASITTGTLTTTKSNDIIYVIISLANSTVNVNNLTDSGTGLNWTRRGEATYSTDTKIETWYAVSPGIFAGTITVTLSAATNCAVKAFGISGANTQSPFNPDPSAAPIPATGKSKSASASIPTTYAGNFIIGAVTANGNNIKISPGTEFTNISSQVNNNRIYCAGEYKIVTTNQTNTPVTFSIDSNENWAMIADVVQGTAVSNAENTGFTIPSTSGNCTLSAGQTLDLYSPTFPSATTIFAGSWIVDLNASAASNGTLIVNLAVVDQSYNVVGSVASGNTATVTTNQSEVSTSFSGSTVVVPSGGRLLASISNPAGSGNTFTIYWGAGGATYFQTPTEYNYALTITNSGTVPHYVSLSVYSATGLNRITSMSITLESPSTNQVVVINGAVTQYSGPVVTLPAGTSTYLRINAEANGFGVTDLVLQVKISAGLGPFAYNYINLNIQ